MSEYVTRASIKGEAIADLWTKHAERFTGSLGRIIDARKLLIGQLQAPLPDVIARRPDGDAFRVDTAQKYTSVMQMVNKLASPAPQLKRPKTATSDLAERTASRIEKFINPAVDANLNNRSLTELALVEAEGCALVVPEAARWQKVAGPYYEDDGETIRPEYARDENGRSYDDELDDAEGDEERAKSAFKPDEKRSRAEYDRHIRDLRARHYPFDVELLSRQQYVPINPRIKGDNVIVDGIITKTRMAPSEAIRRNYVIDGLHEHLEPTSDLEGDMDTGDLWLYLAVMADMDTDGNQYPYFAYSLAGKPTSNSRNGFEKDAVIDLYKSCGLRSLPVVPFYGWHWFTVDPDMRAIPYTFPFMRSWLATDAFLTGKAFAGWSEGMLAWFMQMPDTVKDPAMQQAWMEFVNQNPLVIEPFKVLPVWGNMVPAIHPGTGRDVGEMVSALQGSNQSELVNPLARGGGSSSSAIERTVVSADTVAGISDVELAVANTRRRVGELILEVCNGIGRKNNTSVLIYGNPETPTDSGNETPTRAIIELKPHWLGPEGQESFDLVAHKPKSLGDNLAEKAQAFGFYKEGAITFEDWCSEIGVSDPERYRAQLLFDAWLKTPEGMQVAMKDAAQYLGDQELVKLFDAQQQGAAGPQGQPIGMAAGLNPPSMPMGAPAQAPGAQVATQMADPAMAQQAAIVGAAMQNDAAAVGPTPAQQGAVG